MGKMGMPMKAGIYLVVAAGLGGLVYVRGHEPVRALALAAVVLAAGVVIEGAGVLQARGVLPELHAGSYGELQKPSWHEEGDAEGEGVTSDDVSGASRAPGEEGEGGTSEDASSASGVPGEEGEGGTSDEASHSQ